MKKYTLVLHSYIGYGSYMVHFKKIQSKEPIKTIFRRYRDVHFVIPGWIKVLNENEDTI